MPPKRLTEVERVNKENLALRAEVNRLRAQLGWGKKYVEWSNILHQTGDGTGLRVQRDPNEQATCERFGVTYTD